MIKTEYLFCTETEYLKGLYLQKKKVDELKNGIDTNYIIFLEHEDVITMGIRSRREDLLVDEELLKRENILLVSTDRGGSLTAHGPGQLVIYTIFNLKKCGISVKSFIQTMVDIFKQWLSSKGITGIYNPEHPGLYVNGRKILSIGLKLDNFITYHGFALNLNSIPRGFNYIIPCSMQNCHMTSVYLETSAKYDIREVSYELYALMKERFNNL